MRIADLYWVAGFIEGEGCFAIKANRRRCHISVPQVQRWPLEKLQLLVGGVIYPSRTEKKYTWVLEGKNHCAEAIALMQTLYVLMSPNRQERIREALIAWKAYTPSRVNKIVRNDKGVTGAWLHSSGQKWQAKITVNKISRHLGTFDTMEEAIAAHRSAKQEVLDAGYIRRARGVAKIYE